MWVFRLVLSIRPAVNILRSYYITLPTLNQRKGEKDKKKKKRKKTDRKPRQKRKIHLDDYTLYTPLHRWILRYCDEHNPDI